MNEKIKNTLKIDVIGGTLTGATHIVLYVRQGCTFFKYSPSVLPDSEGKTLIAIIPFSDAMKLRGGENAEVQIAFTDSNGVHRESEIATVPVGRLLDEEGYDGTD